VSSLVMIGRFEWVRCVAGFALERDCVHEYAARVLFIIKMMAGAKAS